MNIIEENRVLALNTLQKNIKPLQHFCVDVLKIAPNANITVLGREVAKYVAFISLGLNPQAVDIPTDTVINEFLNKTKNLADFTICKGRVIYKFVETHPDLIKAAVAVYFTSELSKIKNIDEFLAFDGEEQKPKGLKGFFKNLWGSAKQKAKEEVGKYVEEKSVDAVDRFINWLGEETGIGKGEGNAYNSGGQIYFTYKYYPNNPLNGATQPIKENISKNYLDKVWKPQIEKDGQGNGFNFDIEQRAFPYYFSKIKAGYYKNAKVWSDVVMDDLKKANEKQALKDLNKGLGDNGKSNPIKNFISFLTGK
jgi:hypothetical protein